MEKVVSVRCRSAMDLPLGQLVPFQGQLKDLSDENYERLKREILNTGFSFAVHVWKNPSDQQWYIVDGHQRCETLNRMSKEGFIIPEVPVVPVEADSFQEAKRRVLQGTSQYGRVTGQGLFDFVTEHFSIDDAIASFDLPGIDLEKFKLDYFGEPELNTKQGAQEISEAELSSTLVHQCPRCQFRFSSPK